ncbi:MAG: 50S ribosomal protein L17 [Deltaproteobacteria bacterium]|nr:50S ribosomal protein L17 [Deltaproteobacteria bacterium]
MRHRKARYKLGMSTSHRVAMLRNMVTSLLEHESIVTTDARAKAIRSLADKMITLGKRGDLHARRQALSVIRSKDVTHSLFSDIAPRYADRNGGYTRIIKKGFRPGDGAAVSIVELVDRKPKEATESSSKSNVQSKAKGLKDKLLDKIKSKTE